MVFEVVRVLLLETDFCRGPRAEGRQLVDFFGTPPARHGPGTLQAKGRYACQMWQLPCCWLCKRSGTEFSRGVGRVRQGAWRRTL